MGNLKDFSEKKSNEYVILYCKRYWYSLHFEYCTTYLLKASYIGPTAEIIYSNKFLIACCPRSANNVTNI